MEVKQFISDFNSVLSKYDDINESSNLNTTDVVRDLDRLRSLVRQLDNTFKNKKIVVTDENHLLRLSLALSSKGRYDVAYLRKQLER